MVQLPINQFGLTGSITAGSVVIEAGRIGNINPLSLVARTSNLIAVDLMALDPSSAVVNIESGDNVAVRRIVARNGVGIVLTTPLRRLR